MSKTTKKIAVVGSAKEELLSEKVCNLAEELGKEVAKQGYTLITGAARGISFYAAKGAKEANGHTIGISPAVNKEDSKNYEVSNDYLDEIVFTGSGYKGRNVILVRSCDGLISVNGGFGTLNEITIAEGEVKPIVPIEGTGGSSDLTKDIFKKLNPNYPYFSTAKTIQEALMKIKQFIEKKEYDEKK
jgi:uncharacterized protein (TIGR00725 family)